jgi:hypothetical protein
MHSTHAGVPLSASRRWSEQEIRGPPRPSSSPRFGHPRARVTQTSETRHHGQHGRHRRERVRQRQLVPRDPRGWPRHLLPGARVERSRARRFFLRPADPSLGGGSRRARAPRAIARAGEFPRRVPTRVPSRAFPDTSPSPPHITPRLTPRPRRRRGPRLAPAAAAARRWRRCSIAGRASSRPWRWSTPSPSDRSSSRTASCRARRTTSTCTTRASCTRPWPRTPTRRRSSSPEEERYVLVRVSLVSLGSPFRSSSRDDAML